MCVCICVLQPAQKRKYKNEEKEAEGGKCRLIFIILIHYKVYANLFSFCSLFYFFLLSILGFISILFSSYETIFFF